MLHGNAHAREAHTHTHHTRGKCTTGRSFWRLRQLATHRHTRARKQHTLPRLSSPLPPHLSLTRLSLHTHTQRLGCWMHQVAAHSRPSLLSGFASLSSRCTHPLLCLQAASHIRQTLFPHRRYTPKASSGTPSSRYYRVCSVFALEYMQVPSC